MAGSEGLSILVIADLGTELERQLTKAGYHSITRDRANPEDGWSVALVDISEPDSGGATLIAELKTQQPLASVVALVAEGDVQSAVQAMRARAFNVLHKPVDVDVLLQTVEEGIRLYVANRRNQDIMQEATRLLQQPDHVFSRLLDTAQNVSMSHNHHRTESVDMFQSGEVTFNLKESQAFRGQISLHLTQTEFDLLIYLARANRQVITVEELYYHLHGFHLNKTSARTSLTAHISNARHKLKLVGCENNLINVRGRGYRWNPEGTALNNHEIKLDLLLEQLPILIWTTDTDLRLTSMLGAHLASLPLKTEDMIGLTPQEVFLREGDYLPTLKAQQQALQGQKTTCEQSSGSQIFQVFVEPLLNEQDQIIGCLGFALDITERKHLQEAYELLVNNSNQGMTIFQNGRTMFANSAMARITGYSADELMAMADPASLLIHPDDRAMVVENIRKRLTGEDAPAVYDYRILTKDGDIRWIEHFSMLTSFHNQPAIQTAVIDRTEEKLAHLARRQAEDFCRFLVRNLPDMAVLLFDHDLRYLVAEGQALAEAGYKPGEVEGRTIWEVLPLERAEALIPNYRAALAGQDSRFEWQTEDRSYEIRMLPVRNEHQEIIAGMFLIRILA